MALSTKTRVGSAAATMCAGLLLFGTLGHAGARSDTTRSRPLVERPGCSSGLNDTGHFEQASTTGALQQDITLQVPATALVRVDDGGHVLAALTNTGCAPRPGDDLFYVHPNGSIDAATMRALAHHPWVGDFTIAGVYVLQDR